MATERFGRSTAAAGARLGHNGAPEARVIRRVRRILGIFAKRPAADTLVIKLRPTRDGLPGCHHRYRTWGLDPGTVTCSCGARWQARIR